MEKIIQSKDYPYCLAVKKMFELKTVYPFLRLTSIGKSVLGKDIYCIEIGKSKNPVLYAGAFHGSERINALLLLKFCEELCFCIANDKSMAGLLVEHIFKNRSLFIIPFVNPDGCEIARTGACAAGQKADFIRKISKNNTIKYNANARGVDINHNFPAGWQELHKKEQESGIYGPAPTRYGGSHAASEPETKALISLCEKTGFNHVMAFHSQGEVIYHRYKKSLKKADAAAEILSSLSGYALEDSSGLAFGGGFKDYFIETFGRPGFTIETGKGENPLPITDLDSIYQRIEKMLTVGIML